MVGEKMKNRIKEFIIACFFEALERYFADVTSPRAIEAEPLEEVEITQDVLNEWIYGGKDE